MNGRHIVTLSKLQRNISVLQKNTVHYSSKSMTPRPMNRILLALSLILLVWASSAAAQDITPTDTPSPTASSTPLPSITLTLFRDADSLTLLVPASNPHVSLVGLEFRVALLDGQTIIRRIDRDFAAFLGLPFDQINVIGPSCFRLVKSSTNGPVPIECANGPTLFTQQLAASDIFWFDAGIGLPRIVSLWQDTAFVGLCPAEQSACTLTFVVRPITPTPTPSFTVTGEVQTPASSPTLTPISPPIQPSFTPAPSYPCEGTIINPDGSATIINILYLEASESSQRGPAIRVEAPVTIQRQMTDTNGKAWYLIYDGSRRLGWTSTRFVMPSATCSSR